MWALVASLSGRKASKLTSGCVGSSWWRKYHAARIRLAEYKRLGPWKSAGSEVYISHPCHQHVFQGWFHCGHRLSSSHRSRSRQSRTSRLLAWSSVNDRQCAFCSKPISPTSKPVIADIVDIVACQSDMISARVNKVNENMDEHIHPWKPYSFLTMSFMILSFSHA